MNRLQAEKFLGVFYSLSAILSTASLLCIGIVWSYWHWTLDGCILYGSQTFGLFVGGDTKICHFGVYGLVPGILIGIILGFYHGCRTCIGQRRDESKIDARGLTYDNRSDNEGNIGSIAPKDQSSCKHWLPLTILAALICCLSLAHAAIVTDGYYKTCEQYKKQIIQILGSKGKEVELIHNRLGCGSIFDFMDYLQPDANNWKRGDEINTASSLQFSITLTWFNFLIWGLILHVNFVMTRQSCAATASDGEIQQVPETHELEAISETIQSVQNREESGDKN